MHPVLDLGRHRIVFLQRGAGPEGAEPTEPAVAMARAEGYAAAGRIYAAGDVGVASANLAMNFLMDSDADGWTKKIAAVRAEVGACRTDAPIKATGNLSGEFTWTCDKGRVAGSLLLAPTMTAQIQEWKISAKAP